MKFLEKLSSNKGQVSMEIGILVAAAVAVAAIAAYFYAKNVSDTAGSSGQAANNTINTLGNVSNGTAAKIADLVN